MEDGRIRGCESIGSSMILGNYVHLLSLQLLIIVWAPRHAFEAELSLPLRQGPCVQPSRVVSIHCYYFTVAQYFAGTKVRSRCPPIYLATAVGGWCGSGLDLPIMNEVCLGLTGQRWEPTRLSIHESYSRRAMKPSHVLMTRPEFAALAAFRPVDQDKQPMYGRMSRY